MAKSLAELIGPAIDPVLRKRGLARAELLSWWPDIVGEAYAGSTTPERIKWSRDGGAAVLFVRCDPAYALQLAHESDRIRERLNGYFGYPAVAEIRIVQHRMAESRAVKEQPQSLPELPPAKETQLAGLEPKLQDSLRELGRRILSAS